MAALDPVDQPAEPLALRGERRWPMAVAVLAAAVMHSALPEQLRVQQSPWLPWIAVVILVAIVIGDPGRIDRLRTWIRVLTDFLIAAITVANAYAAVMLVYGIVNNESFTDPKELLIAGGMVWLTNVIAFALWYWDLDQGGPAERANGTSRTPAFVFPEMQHKDHVGPGWRPVFVDYLAFAFATATAFSPTDVSAIKPWSKMMTVAEALISFALAALVIARAINVLT